MMLNDFEGHLGTIWSHLEAILGHLGAILGLKIRDVGAIFAHIEASWGQHAVQERKY